MNPHRPDPRCRQHRPRALTCALLCLLALAAAPGAARCLDEESLQAFTGGDTAAASSTVEPRLQLQQMVREALSRSNAVGASALLAEAALSDIDETRAARAVQANVGGGFGPGGSKTVGIAETAATQLRAYADQ